MLTIPNVILTAALFLAMTVNLAMKPAHSARVTSFCMMSAVAYGLLVYGTGFIQVTGDPLFSMVRAVFCVMRMFVGVNELSAIAGSTFVSTPALVDIYWIFQLMALYSTASAIMISIGAAALKQLRLFLARRGELTLIYGVNDNSIAVGKECRAAGGTSVVFVAESAPAATVRDLNDLGMSVLTGYAAVHSDEHTIRKLRVRGRKITVYALDAAEDQNLFYALELKDVLEREGVEPKDTRITLPGAEDIITSMLQVSPERYGFGYVNVYDTGMLAARAMIRLCPPWEFMHFDEDGRATENFECVVVGFGHYGQAALRQLLINGQFAGSTFRAAVFSPNFKNECGYLLTDSPEMLKRYDIQSFPADGRSKEFYDYIGQRLDTLKMIAVCTGSETNNSEISDNLMLFLKRRRAENICVVQCGRTGVRYQETVGSPILRGSIFCRAMLSAEDADRRAIVLNSIYDDSDRTDWEKWVACDTFSKMSSRASADFLPAFLKIAGTSREEVLSGEWKPDRELQQTLGETEHLRWNAFHFSMGYEPMSREEFEENARIWTRCRDEGVPSPVRINKNQQARTHACLVSWDELDELSARDNAITGRGVDYKQLDINNVLALPAVLRADEKGEEAT